MSFPVTVGAFEDGIGLVESLVANNATKLQEGGGELLRGTSNAVFHELVWVEIAVTVRTGAFDFEVLEEVDAVGNAATVGTGEGWGVMGEVEFTDHADRSRLVTVGADAGLCEDCGLAVRAHDKLDFRGDTSSG
jgi:hypothetical protein